MNGSELLRRFVAIFCCVTLVFGCGAKKESQSTNETQAPKTTQAQKETRTAEDQASSLSPRSREKREVSFVTPGPPSKRVSARVLSNGTT